MRRRLLVSIAHPGRHILTRLLLKRTAESAVTMIAALLGELLDSKVAIVVNSLVIETDEMLDAQIVDIVVVMLAAT